MFDAIRLIAERKIIRAIKEGTMNTERWKGIPLPEENESFVPEDLRMAYKILKNSGFLPPEIEARKKIQQLEDLISSTDAEHKKLKQMKKLNLMTTKVNIMRNGPINLEKHEHYFHKIVEKISVK